MPKDMHRLYRIHVFFICVCLSLLPVTAGLGCRGPITLDEYYDSQIEYRTRPYKFDHFSWQVNALLEMAEKSIFKPYTNSVEEAIIDRIKEVLTEQGIKVFPDVRFKMDQPPYLLVISLRDKIVYYDRVLLSREITSSQIADIEDAIDALGLSSVVVELGGFAGTYPPIIMESKNISFVIETAIEEWLHQYLVFRPLGFLYLLDCIGIQQEAEIITINETLAGIVSEEVGKIVYDRYYVPESPNNRKVNMQANNFNFDKEMRETRRQVDILLKIGDVIGAENYMEIQRQIFLANGYQIRKLNQAYFAFHSIYAYDPASVSPIYEQLRQLRDRSDSLTQFIDIVASMTSYEDLSLQVKSGPVR